MDASFWEEVERSKAMTPEQRFLGTLEMIDLSRELNMAGIRLQYPDADEDRVRELLIERHRIVREVENRW